MPQLIVLFGEAEKGDFSTPIVCKSLPQLADNLGHPPENSRGIFYGVQALLFEKELVFFRVKEEGFSIPDYLRGLNMLKKMAPSSSLSALCLPGVGDTDIIDESIALCHHHQSLLIVNEMDLYDYLTSSKKPN
jgi:hypothetical protein